MSRLRARDLRDLGRSESPPSQRVILMGSLD